VSYIPGQPVTGFSLILDGDEETVRAILDAAMKEMGRQFDRAERERDHTLMPLGVGYYRIPVYPVRGEIHLRTGQ